MLARCVVCICAQTLISFHSFSWKCFLIIFHCAVFFRFLFLRFFMTRMESPNMHNNEQHFTLFSRSYTEHTHTHTHCITSLCVQLSSCSFFFSFIFITNIFMDCIWWTAVNPFGHWAKDRKERVREEVEWDEDWKASFLQTLNTYIDTYMLNVLCAGTVKFVLQSTHFLSGNRRHLWCFNFILITLHSHSVSWNFSRFHFYWMWNVGYSPIYYPIHPSLYFARLLRRWDCI